MDAYAPIKGKCLYWREALDAEDEYTTSVKESEKRVECTCFVEGYYWPFVVATVPEDCPLARRCRYHIKSR